MSISTSAMIHCVKAIWLAIQWLCRINILCDEVDCNTNPRNKENANWCFFISADFSKTNRQLLTNYNSLPKLEFGFRAKHFTIQQRHRLVDVIFSEKHDVRFAIFLDVIKEFYKAWYFGLFYKLRKFFNENIYF